MCMWEKTEEKEGRKRERVCVCCAYMAVFMRVLAHVCACACGGQRATLGVVLSTVYSVYFSWDRVSWSLSGLELSYELGLLVLGICVCLCLSNTGVTEVHYHAPPFLFYWPVWFKLKFSYVEGKHITNWEISQPLKSVIKTSFQHSSDLLEIIIFTVSLSDM